MHLLSILSAVDLSSIFWLYLISMSGVDKTKAVEDIQHWTLEDLILFCS